MNTDSQFTHKDAHRAEIHRTLAKLRGRLILNSSDPLANESKVLYELIEHTLLNELKGNDVIHDKKD